MPRILKHEGAMLVELPPDVGHSADAQERSLKALVEAGRKATRLVVDLGRVRGAQAALLTLLLKARHRLGSRPGDIVVVADELQASVFRVTRLDGLFVLRPTRSEAVRAAWPVPEPHVVEGGAQAS